MPHAGRNDQCPCGSSKKYKHCYGKVGSGCRLLFQEQRKKLIGEHDAREKEVVKFFNEVTEETTVINLKDSEGNDQIPVRIQVITIFSLIDVLGSYWYEYLGKTGKTNERAQAWYEAFCMTEKNKHYTGLWRDLSSNRLYAFRNALVHFFGFGEESEGISIALCPNNTAEEKRLGFEKLMVKAGRKLIMIRPKDFSNLVKEGAILMMQSWMEAIHRAQKNPEKEAEYIAAIERVWSKVRKEGAVRIEKDRAEPLINSQVY